MPDDIVERLRDYSARGAVFATNDMCWEAADEIERLREALDEYKHRLHWANEELLKRGRS